MACQAFSAARLSSISAVSFSPRCSSEPQSQASGQNSHVTPRSNPVPPLSFTQEETPSVAHLAMDPSAAFANVMWFRGPYQTQIFVGEREPAESIVRRFRKAVMEANVIGECRRRKNHETKQDIVKRKQKEGAITRRRMRNQSNGPRPYREYKDDSTEKAKAKNIDEDDNWSVEP